jgi:hypothetical protein
MATETKPVVPTSPDGEQFDLDSHTEAMGKCLNTVATVTRTLALKYVSYSVSANELTKDGDEGDKSAVGKLVVKVVKARKLIEDTHKELDALAEKFKALEF